MKMCLKNKYFFFFFGGGGDVFSFIRRGEEKVISNTHPKQRMDEKYTLCRICSCNVKGWLAGWLGVPISAHNHTKNTLTSPSKFDQLILTHSHIKNIRVISNRGDSKRIRSVAHAVLCPAASLIEALICPFPSMFLKFIS
jgi:hypothetical protein